MIGKVGLIKSKDFKVGLYTGSDIVQPNLDFSPNCMNIKWYFDSSIGKRFGSSTTNSVMIASGNLNANVGFIVQNSLTNNLIAYWNLNEPSGTRFDSFGTSNLLQPVGDESFSTGIRGNALYLPSEGGSGAGTGLFVNGNASLSASETESFTLSCWVYLEDTANANTKQILYKTSANSTNIEYRLSEQASSGVRRFVFHVTTGGGAGVTNSIYAQSIGAPVANTWYNIVAWHSNATHIGISVNLSVNTLSIGSGMIVGSGGQFIVGNSTTASNTNTYPVRIDETSFWKRGLSLTERQQLYAGGSGNTYSSAGALDGSSWYSFDFGATGIRWLTVAAGSGILASSNGGTTFVSVATTRTAAYQYLDVSKNVLLATSDAYDQTLYWAGSVGTFFQALAINSAPKAKFSINYQGFAILLNYQNSNGVISNRGFAYADENIQLTSSWPDSFVLPSSDSDEITAAFILNRFLYVSTKYKIFRVYYAGGNPDWGYIQVRNWGFVPRTVKVFTMKQTQVATGLDWNRRLRTFSGNDDEILTDNVENFNDDCEFAMDNISLAGSGLLISNAEFDPIEQEYRINVAIGAQSTQTTHALVLNSRTLGLYPYSNQPFNTMCMAESAGQQLLMAFDRSGFCHILNSGNLDSNTIAINDFYDSPLLFKNSPSEVTKNQQINFFFTHESAGTIYYQERFDFSNVFSLVKPLRNYEGQTALTGMESSVIINRTVDLPSVQNIYQYRLTSSSGTAVPWKLVHLDLFNSQLGVGRGK